MSRAREYYTCYGGGYIVHGDTKSAITTIVKTKHGTRIEVGVCYGKKRNNHRTGVSIWLTPKEALEFGQSMVDMAKGLREAHQKTVPKLVPQWLLP